MARKEWTRYNWSKEYWIRDKLNKNIGIRVTEIPGGVTKTIPDVMLGLRSKKMTLIMAWQSMISGP